MENKKTQHIRTIILMALILFGLVFFVNIATKDSSDNSTETATKKMIFQTTMMIPMIMMMKAIM